MSPAGFHLEGPFISAEKKGAHPEQFLRTFQPGGFQDLMDTYGSLDGVAMVTLAPELSGSRTVVRELCQRGIKVSLGDPGLKYLVLGLKFSVCITVLTSLRGSGSDPAAGHSVADLSQAEEAVQHGASCITHLFNAMQPVSPRRSPRGSRDPLGSDRLDSVLVQFHHRDPGIVGLLTSDKVPAGRTVFYGMIADGIHTNPAALRIAHRAHPSGESFTCCRGRSLELHRLLFNESNGITFIFSHNDAF